VRLLKRFTDELLLVFDADRAGKAAAFKAIELVAAHQMRTRVATVPAPAKDPMSIQKLLKRFGIK